VSRVYAGIVSQTDLALAAIAILTADCAESTGGNLSTLSIASYRPARVPRHSTLALSGGLSNRIPPLVRQRQSRDETGQLREPSRRIANRSVLFP